MFIIFAAFWQKQLFVPVSLSLVLLNPYSLIAEIDSKALEGLSAVG